MQKNTPAIIFQHLTRKTTHKHVCMCIHTCVCVCVHVIKIKMVKRKCQTEMIIHFDGEYSRKYHTFNVGFRKVAMLFHIKSTDATIRFLCFNLYMYISISIWLDLCICVCVYGYMNICINTCVSI